MGNSTFIAHPSIQLKPGREWPLLRGHPWMFSGAIMDITGEVSPGILVDLVDSDGLFVARGYYNPNTDIAVRILTQDAAEDIDTNFFVQRLEQALSLRQQTIDLSQTNLFRLVHGEGDFLPGLVIDWYDGIAVLQSHTAGIDQLLTPIIQALVQVLSPQGILLRTDLAVRSREGLARSETRVLYGEVPAELTVKEHNLNFIVDPWRGQKTGFYADQRDKRKVLQRYSAALAPGAKLLNCFCYSAGFSVYASAANPTLTTINLDQSAPALELAQRNFSLNQLNPANHQFIVADAFEWLPTQPEETYDIVLLDPPAFAKSKREQAKANQGYLRLNRWGLALVKPGGILVTCSCSGTVSLADFITSLREASMEVGRTVQILETFGHGPDHPLHIMAPEGEYLKVLFCRVF